MRFGCGKLKSESGTDLSTFNPHRRNVLVVTAGLLAVSALRPLRADAAARVITGFNQNWSMLPPLDTPGLIGNISRLKPQMLRYPGGTVTHNWDWRAGGITTRKTLALHPVSDVALLSRQTGAAMTFVVDVVRGTLDDQIEMLNALKAEGLAVTHVELGNEVYAGGKGYETVYPTGADYGGAMVTSAQGLRNAFPGAKIGAVLLGREPGQQNDRTANWNAGVVPAVRDAVDAFIFHIYQSEQETADQTERRFARVADAAETGTKELWVTEYGTHQPAGSAEAIGDLQSLADFIEGFPNATIALNHPLIGGDMAKITPDGSALTPEGEMFAKRVSR